MIYDLIQRVTRAIAEEDPDCLLKADDVGVPCEYDCYCVRQARAAASAVADAAWEREQTDERCRLAFDWLAEELNGSEAAE